MTQRIETVALQCSGPSGVHVSIAPVTYVRHVAECVSLLGYLCWVSGSFIIYCVKRVVLMYVLSLMIA